MAGMKGVGLLHFEERYYERIWGGDRLRTVYGKDAPEGVPVGEAWLVSDHPGDESVVDEGPLAGETLHGLLQQDAAAILGKRAELTIHGRFPLLLKILDSRDHLSVQVHPDDECAKRLGEPDVGKTEMWHVLHADPGSELICGLDPSASRDRFAAAVQDGSVEDLMTRFEVGEDTSAFVSAGTVHAIGGGIILAEIQQNSDLTYRIYDWGRVQADGTSRELHVEKSVEAIHFGSPHGGTANPLTYSAGSTEVDVLAACRYFSAERIKLNGTYSRSTRGDSFHILLAAAGEPTVCVAECRRVLEPGQAVLVVGDCEQFSIEGEGAILDYYVPDLALDVVDPLLSAGHDRDAIIRLGGDPAHSDIVC
ncbi:MAG: mannose-6-phosphate isomerase [bacterium]|nr:mannose-6-phosphate isomerase [bacterium]